MMVDLSKLLSYNSFCDQLESGVLKGNGKTCTTVGFLTEVKSIVS